MGHEAQQFLFVAGLVFLLVLTWIMAVQFMGLVLRMVLFLVVITLVFFLGWWGFARWGHAPAFPIHLPFLP